MYRGTDAVTDQDITYHHHPIGQYEEVTWYLLLE